MKSVFALLLFIMLGQLGGDLYAQEVRSKITGVNFGLGNHLLQQQVQNSNAEIERGGGLNAHLGYVFLKRYELFILGDISILNKPVQTDAFNHIGYGINIHFNSDRDAFRPYVGVERANISNLLINGPNRSLLSGQGYAATVGFGYFIYKQFGINFSASLIRAEYDRFRLNAETISDFNPVGTHLIKLRAGFRVVI